MHRYWPTLFLAGSLFAMFSGCSPLPINSAVSLTADLPFSKDFEDNSFSELYLETASVSSAIIVSSPVFAGTRALQLTVSLQDLVNHGNRAEVAIYNLCPYGETLFYGWRFMIPTSDPDDYKWQILSQWYQLPDFKRGETFAFFGAHPPVVLACEPGQVVVQTNAGGEKTLARTSLSKGEWHSVVFEIHFRNDDTGFLQVWLDGNPLTPPNGVDNRVYTATLHNRAGAYWKLGLYRGPNTAPVQALSTNTVYIDNIRVGRTYAEVMP